MNPKVWIYQTLCRNDVEGGSAWLISEHPDREAAEYDRDVYLRLLMAGQTKWRVWVERKAVPAPRKVYDPHVQQFCTDCYADFDAYGQCNCADSVLCAC